MKEIPNERFVEKGMYVNPLTFRNGLIVARAFPPRGYIKKLGKEGDAWLPEIIICEAKENAPVKITGRGIVAKSPAQFYVLQFNPNWNEKENKNKNMIYRFYNSFIPQEIEEIGDIAVIKHKITGHYDGYNTPGEIFYSGISNRDITLHGSKSDLENMIMLASSNLPSKSYDLKFSAPCCANSDKYYKIKIDNSEISNFAKKVANELF